MARLWVRNGVASQHQAVSYVNFLFGVYMPEPHEDINVYREAARAFLSFISRL